jgi:hypothetical protein
MKRKYKSYDKLKSISRNKKFLSLVFIGFFHYDLYKNFTHFYENPLK